ncbi:hypothetical protein [Nostoc sp. C110]|uniref:hypothetical protein n=1 Tax=Nostoc sp. C110 TaxID=3349876 RepID=UPI00370DB0D8
MDIPPGLAAILGEYQLKPGAMFPGMRGVTERLTRFMADKILRDACKRIGVEGVSTHSVIKVRSIKFFNHFWQLSLINRLQSFISTI